MKNIDENWVHFINIGGVTTAPLALTLKDMGFKVSGTDTNLYDPIKGFLKRNNIEVFEDYSHKNLIYDDKFPGKVIAGSGISLKNKELLFARKQSMNVKHFPEYLNKKCIVENSIVIAGTFGKTTITSALVHILKDNNINISYMYGGLSENEEIPLRLSDSNTKFSVVEGDEYISSRWDPKSKFFYYSPKFLILTSVEWDHTDIFKSEKDYIENFKKLVEKIPKDGYIFANKEDKNVLEVVKAAKCKVELYNANEILAWGEENGLKSKIFGKLNRKNGLIASKFASFIGLEISKIRESLKAYTGIKRRLEVRYPSVRSNVKYQMSKVVIVDDFASSPPKVMGSLKDIKDELPDHKIVCIFEPNAGNRTEEALPNFMRAFEDSDMVLLPRFESLISSDRYPINETKLKNFLEENNVDVKGFSSDEELIEYCASLYEEGKYVAFVFMASFGMEERIKMLVNKIKIKD